jgi:hypothetical protein
MDLTLTLLSSPYFWYVAAAYGFGALAVAGIIWVAR